MSGAGEGGDSVAAGSEVSMKLQGSACHGGGSCQWALSYDNGENWMVIQSQIGGCPITGSNSGGGQGTCQLDFSVPIPKDAPSGPAIFAWTWYNRVGNREMYMNCAMLNIENGGDGFSAPQLDTANIFGDGVCTTPEGVDWVYANPGNIVTYGGSYTEGNAPATTYGGSCDFVAGEITVDGSGKVTQGGNGTPLDDKIAQASGAAPEADASASGAASPAGNDGQYTPDAQESATDAAEDAPTDVGDFTQKSVDNGSDEKATTSESGSNPAKKLLCKQDGSSSFLKKIRRSLRKRSKQFKLR